MRLGAHRSELYTARENLRRVAGCPLPGLEHGLRHGDEPPFPPSLGAGAVRPPRLTSALSARRRKSQRGSNGQQRIGVRGERLHLRHAHALPGLRRSGDPSD